VGADRTGSSTVCRVSAGGGKGRPRHTPAWTETLHALCARWGLDARAEGVLRGLLELLASDPAAPTAVREPERAVFLHVADSLAGLPFVLEESGPAVDIGSGAGLPGLVLAAARPELALDLVEATGGKCRFIERATSSLGLANVRAVWARAEDWAREEGAGRYGLALARAVASLPTLAEYGAPLLREGGRLICWKGAAELAEEEAGARAAAALGLRGAGAERAAPFPGGDERRLHVFEKVAPTPSRFPRRAGMAAKRPLG